MAPRGVLLVGMLLVLAGCSGSGSPAAAPVPGPSSSGLAAPETAVSLPADALLPLVPTPAEVPTGMVPLLTSSGPRDAAAIAAFSADPGAAAKDLAAHGFQRAYVAQYAEPTGSRVLSVVVSRFADAAGATADLAGDLAASSGEALPAPDVGEQSQARRQPLPGTTPGQLVTLRFRQGATTWLLAYGDRPSADAAAVSGLAPLLVARAG